MFFIRCYYCRYAASFAAADIAVIAAAATPRIMSRYATLRLRCRYVTAPYAAADSDVAVYAA